MRQLATSTLSNQDISSALLVYTYTADAARAVMFRVALDQVAGNGDYSIYLTLQPLGTGSAYKSHVATVTAASGVTAIVSPSIILSVNDTDVVKIYVKGLAGDTATPDITTWVFELVHGEQVDLVNAPNATAIGAIQSGLAVPGDAMTLTVGERGSVASAVLAAVVEGTHTVAQYLRGFAAVLLGKSSNRGAAYRDVDDTKTRVDATLDDEGNRIAITLDLD